MAESNRSIFDNPKLLASPALLQESEDGILTRRWRERVAAFYRSVVPRHVSPDEQRWITSAPELAELVSRLQHDDAALADVRYVCFVEPISDVYDLVDFLQRLKTALPSDAKVACTIYNWAWTPIFRLAGMLGFSRNRPVGSIYRRSDFRCFLEMSGWEEVKEVHWYLLPLRIPLLSHIVDGVLIRLPVLRNFSLNTFYVLRPVPEETTSEHTVSVLIPCRNEEGNVEAAVRRMPNFGRELELVFVNDRSTDGTESEVRRAQDLYPERRILLVQGRGAGKAEAVREGMKAASGDICMILDADLAVIPEDLPQFYLGMRARRADFIHGTRLVYPPEKEAMRFANVVGNVFFSWVFSFILDQRTSDTLCGTKAFWRADWPAFEQMRDELHRRDVWGDYNLIFGASQYGLKIGQLPVRYFERLEGVSKMTKRLKNGLIMLRISWMALWRLKFGI